MSHHDHPAATHEHGLQDDCPRCSEHADHPFESLDAENLHALVERTLAWMRDEAVPRSQNEGRAMAVVERTIRGARAMARLGFDPTGRS